ncbi:MAG: TonB-dependent receptor [Treponema sp.]|jgi:vitamin B12 transporter|nr:TonB-dependent receptor [Treponema sp.]
MGFNTPPFSAGLLIATLLFSLALFPLRAQEEPGNAGSFEDDFSGDDTLFLEDEGITIVSAVETTQQMEIVTREEIEKFHSPDLPALLEEALGLGVTRYGPYGSMAEVNIRGFDTERIAVLVDGLPVNSTRSGDFDFNTVDINAVERIEVIHGGSDTKYNVSGALGGIINIVTVKKQEPGWSVAGSVSNSSALPGWYSEQHGGIADPKWQDLADTQKLNVSGAYGAEDYSFKAALFGGRAGNHFLYQDDYGYARRKEGNEVWDMGASASLLREFPDLSRLIFSGDVYYGDKHIPASGYTAEYAEQRDFSSRQNLMFDMPRAFHDDFSAEFSLGHNWTFLSYDPGRESSRHNENGITLINRWGWYPADKITLRFGGDYRFIRLDSTNDGIHNGHRAGLYLTSEYKPAGKILLILSLKGVTDGRNLIPVPKLGLSWKPADSFTLKNNYFRSFKFPDFDDLYWVQSGYQGNPDLRPEDGWGADLSAEFDYRDWLSLNSALYGEWTKDSIHWNNASGFWQPENISEGFFLGLDNRIKLIFPALPLLREKPVFSVFWQFQPSWLLNSNTGFSDNIRIPYMPMHALGLSLELPWKAGSRGLPGSFILSGRFESARYADTANLVELEPHFILNADFNQELNRRLALFGTIHNIFNARYVSFADYPMPGFILTAGMRLRYKGGE